MEHAICAVLILGLAGINYGLVNRLVRQSGQRPLVPVSPAEAVWNKMMKTPNPEPKPRLVSGSRRITP